MIEKILSISKDIRYVAVYRGGRFFQFVLPTEWGHVSVCIDRAADPVAIGEEIRRTVKTHA